VAKIPMSLSTAQRKCASSVIRLAIRQKIVKKKMLLSAQSAITSDTKIRAASKNGRRHQRTKCVYTLVWNVARMDTSNVPKSPRAGTSKLTPKSLMI
jgi:hypothetical protein